jgi:MFS family permease
MSGSQLCTDIIAPRTDARRRDLRAIQGDGLGFSLMVGLGETYLPAFVLALGVREVTAGMLPGATLLLGAMLQLAAPWGVQRCGSLRRWVVGCVVVQAASLVGLAAGAAQGALPLGALAGLVVLYWSTGLAAGPAWSTWVARLVPVRMQARFWARRARLAHAGILGGVLLGGFVLHRMAERGAGLAGFACIFTAAAACRAASARCVSQQSDVPLPSLRRVSAREFLRRCRRGTDGRLLVFVLGAQWAVQLSAPYFTPFMLRHQQLPYATYVVLLSASYLAKVACLPLLGRLAQRRGARRLLLLGGAGIAPLPLLWLLGDALPYLVAINVLSGAVWAAWELGTFLLLVETLREEERTSLLTTFNLANALATVGGALAGGILLSAGGGTERGYAVLFAVSSLARGAVLVVLGREAGVLRLPTLQDRVRAACAQSAGLLRPAASASLRFGRRGLGAALQLPGVHPLPLDPGRLVPMRARRPLAPRVDAAPCAGPMAAPSSSPSPAAAPPRAHEAERVGASA